MSFGSRSGVWHLLLGLVVLVVVGSLVADVRADSGVSFEAVADAADAGQEPAKSAPAQSSARETSGDEEPQPRAFTEMIDNIVVTTRKRQEAIQETPLSITALGENSLKQLGVRRIQDISQAIPNLNYDRTVGFTAARVNARGVGQTDPIGTLDPGVGLYVDGVFLPRAQAGLMSIADVERIEVVRGPQGTIFGKNTIGGAVNVITRAPQMDFGAEAEVRVGNFNLFETRATLNVPIVDERVAARFGLATATRDGFEKERLGGTDPNDEKLLAARFQLLMLPTDNLEILLAADTSRENQVLSQGKCLPVNSGATQQLQILNAVAGFTDACAEVARSSNPRRVETDISFLKDDLETYGGSARISWQLGQGTSLRSISAIRGLDSENFNDFDNTRVELIRPAIDDVSFKQSQISQELQFSSSALDGKLDYVIGLFGFKEKSNDQLFEGVLSRLTGDGIALPEGGQFQGAASILQPIVDGGRMMGLSEAQIRDQIANLFRGGVIGFTTKVNNVSYSAFGQATYNFTDRLSLTAGLRLTQDRRRVFRRGVAETSGNGIAVQDNGLPTVVNPGDVTTLFERSRRDSDFTPSASLSYKFTNDLLGYVGYSTGFKSGGFNGRAFPLPGDDSLPIEISPEDLTTYELGLKASFLDDRIALNAAAFYSIYEDIQLVVLLQNQNIQNVNIALLNAGESRIQGGELEMVLAPFPNLQIRSSVGILHDRFTDFDDPSDPRAEDRHLQFLSSYQTSTSIEYSLPLFSMGVLTARTDWSTRSRQFLDVTNAEALEAGKYGLLDARLSLQLSDGATELAVFGKNLLDREYLVSGVDFTATFGQVSRFVGPPRTYGLEVRRRF
jgi:iron complex outermembrane recepter protein